TRRFFCCAPRRLARTPLRRLCASCSASAPHPQSCACRSSNAGGRGGKKPCACRPGLRGSTCWNKPCAATSSPRACRPERTKCSRCPGHSPPQGLLAPPLKPFPTMLWFALIPKPIEGHSPEQAQRLLAWWALRWSPRVACLEEAVVVEVAASLRLFGGEAALYQRLQAAAIPVGFRSLTRGPTSLGALALARHGGGDGLTRPWREVLDALPLSTLSAASRHHATLSRLGCQ